MAPVDGSGRWLWCCGSSAYLACGRTYYRSILFYIALWSGGYTLLSVIFAIAVLSKGAKPEQPEHIAGTGVN